MSGSPLRWPTKQVCIKCPFTQDLSSSPTGIYMYIVHQKHHFTVERLTLPISVYIVTALAA